ncbi:hypothetical protein BC629DRAFT_926046 [Irpex lacteus]|nr:hypothetical protein BC629DRAFT_926046 [Irpex lacteus]
MDPAELRTTANTRDDEQALLSGGSLTMDLLLVSRSRHNASQSIFKLPPELLYLIIEHLRIIYLPVGMSDTYRFDSPQMSRFKTTLLGGCTSHTSADSSGMLPFHSENYGPTYDAKHVAQFGYQSGFVAQQACPFHSLFYRGISAVKTIRRSVTFLPRHLNISQEFAPLKSSSRRPIPCVETRWRTLLTGPAPQLEVLEIQSRTHESLFLPSPWFTSAACATPTRLRRLVASNLCFPWQTAHLAYLTHLDLSRPFSSDSTVEAAWDVSGRRYTELPRDVTHPSMEHVWECLRRSPLLQYLRLFNFLPHYPIVEDIQARTRKITLPKLQEIHIEDHCYCIAVFLAALDAPRVQSANIRLASGMGHGYQWIVDYLASCTRRSTRPILALAVEANMVNWSVKTCPDAVDTMVMDNDRSPPMTSEPSFSFVISCSRRSALQQDHAPLKALIGALPLEDVETLLSSSDIENIQVDSFDTIASDLWSFIYECCTSAKTVRIVGMAIVHCVPLLAAGGDIPSLRYPPINDHWQQIPMLPAMTHLTLGFGEDGGSEAYIAECFLQRAQPELELATPECEHASQYVQVVRDYLASRAGRTALLEHLKLDVHDAGESDVNIGVYGAQLREVAAEV